LGEQVREPYPPPILCFDPNGRPYNSPRDWDYWYGLYNQWYLENTAVSAAVADSMAPPATPADFSFPADWLPPEKSSCLLCRGMEPTVKLMSCPRCKATCCLKDFFNASGECPNCRYPRQMLGS
jgi:hypothetical protein